MVDEEPKIIRHVSLEQQEIIRDTLTGKIRQAEATLSGLGIRPHKILYAELHKRGYVWDEKKKEWTREGLYDMKKRVYQKICTECGDPFTAKRSDAKTCSNACRKRAYRRNNRD